MTFETFLLILLGLDLIATFCFWLENRRLKEEIREIRTEALEMIHEQEKLEQAQKAKVLNGETITCTLCKRIPCYYCN